MRREPMDPRPDECAVLVDYDNFYKEPGTTREELTHRLNKLVSLALDAVPNVELIAIRLYGGWLEEGILTRRASELQSLLGTSYFPIGHPNGGHLVRGNVVLVTRLVAVPTLEWAHTFRQRVGLPRLRLAQKPRPAGCANHASCPIDQLQRISRRRTRECHVAGCGVTNDTAFLLEEQKLVDALICCDTLALAGQGVPVIVVSNDLDVLPALAMAGTLTESLVLLARGVIDEDSAYTQPLEAVGVQSQEWTAA